MTDQTTSTGAQAAPAPQASATPPFAPQPSAPVSDKSFVLTWLFAWLFGGIGVDRFYLGKVGTGLLKLFTFGGLGVWWLIDLILVLAGAQRDKAGRRLAGYEQHKKVAWIVTAVAVALGMVLGTFTNANADRSDSSAAPIASEEQPDAVESEPEEPVEVETETVQDWADRTYGSFAEETLTGAGDDLIALPVGVNAGIVTATHDGGSNFVLSVLDASNQPTGDLLVNEIGSYSGTTAYGFTSFGEGTTVQVSADGNWSVTLAPISSAPAIASSGSGDAVFLYDGAAGKLTATHDGSSNFVVSEQTGDAFHFGLLVNEIGAYSGTVPLAAGPSVITVNADGGWTLVVG